jgi:tetratricopeptide (TPR) repeat protein
MYRDNFKEEQEDIHLLVRQYEEMLNKDGVGFFEKKQFTQLINYYEANDKIKKALNVIENALEQHPFSATFYIRKAQFLIDDNKEPEALELLEQAELYDASEIDIYLLRADILSTYRRFEEALDILEFAGIKMSKSDLDELYLAYANVYEDMEDFDKMFEALQNALQIDYDCEEALERLWLCTEVANKYEESIALHNEILDKNAYNYLAWFNLGHAYSGLKMYEQAVEAFEYSFVINESFELAYISCVDVLFELEDYDKAIDCLQKGLEHLPKSFEFCMFLGRAFEEKEDIRQAKNAYIKAARINDKHAEAFYRLGECYAYEDRWVHALSAYETAFKIDAFSATYAASVAEANYQLDNNEKANELFKAAVELDITDLDIWVQYLSFLIDIREFELTYEAMAIAEEYCQDVELKCCKVAAYYQDNKKKEAISLLTQLLLEDKSAGEILLELFPDLKEETDILNTITNFSA